MYDSDDFGLDFSDARGLGNDFDDVGYGSVDVGSGSCYFDDFVLGVYVFFVIWDRISMLWDRIVLIPDWICCGVVDVGLGCDDFRDWGYDFYDFG